MKIDVLVMASSRPDLLKITCEKFKEYITFRDGFRWMIHEDFVYPEESKKSVEYALNNFDIVESSLPKIGVGYAMDKMFKSVESDYLFYLQDDWEQPHICAYCKKEFPMTVRNYINMIRRIGFVYCSIECEQADETKRKIRKEIY